MSTNEARSASTERPYYTVSQLAARWDCSEKHVRRLIDRKELVAHRFGGLLRISADDLQRYERQNRDV